MTSGVLWKNYHRMNLILHLPLPIQIMGIRFLMMVSAVHYAPVTKAGIMTDVLLVHFGFCFTRGNKKRKRNRVVIHG